MEGISWQCLSTICQSSFQADLLTKQSFVSPEKLDAVVNGQIVILLSQMRFYSMERTEASVCQKISGCLDLVYKIR